VWIWKGCTLGTWTKRCCNQCRRWQTYRVCEKTGKVGYVVKWWESEFPVTIESTSIRSVSAVGYYSNLKIDIPDPNVQVSGKVYLSEYFEYGRLLKANNLSIGKYENDAFYPEIPQISNYVVLLEEYQDHLGTAVDKGE